MSIHMLANQALAHKSHEKGKEVELQNNATYAHTNRTPVTSMGGLYDTTTLCVLLHL